MKSIILFLVIVFSVSAFAQEQTLFDIKEVEHGGYGAFVMKFCSVNNEFGVLVGGRGGWIIDHTFAIGGAGYGLANNVHSRVVGPWGERFVNFGYGGLDLEYIVNSDDLVHLSIHSLVGAGAVGFRGSWEGNQNFGMDNRMGDVFFVLEPGVNIDLNVTKWFRTSLGMSYRYLSGVSSESTTNTDLQGPSAMLSYPFGKY
jgi:hypothetical protein